MNLVTVLLGVYTNNEAKTAKAQLGLVVFQCD